MRSLAAIDIPAALRRGKSVERFLGRGGRGKACIVTSCAGAIQRWGHDVGDIGSEHALDLYHVPYQEADGPEAPVATFADPQGALAYAHAALAADTGRWVNEGVAQSEYLDDIRAGRPAKWPHAR
ncbi:hypothetical protein [Xanthomonas sacchari]|uniref:hypothetical protein n=1 Tax=Xanthomonas sacchari TaxID=56458 RepID=UPI0020C44950|nr:hypothetical protein [Xanthomonas sacchari]